MASDINFVNYVIDQIRGSGDLRHKKMFGEYLIYCDNKPVVLVCDNTAFVKICDCVKKYLENADIGFPYKGAKEHYILDVDNSELLSKVVNELAVNLPAPQLKKSKSKKL
jgi:TfoX/Sxy family transcriptional regulator of competence genes